MSPEYLSPWFWVCSPDGGVRKYEPSHRDKVQFSTDDILIWGAGGIMARARTSVLVKLDDVVAGAVRARRGGEDGAFEYCERRDHKLESPYASAGESSTDKVCVQRAGQRFETTWPVYLAAGDFFTWGTRVTWYACERDCRVTYRDWVGAWYDGDLTKCAAEPIVKDDGVLSIREAAKSLLLAAWVADCRRAERKDRRLLLL